MKTSRWAPVWLLVLMAVSETSWASGPGTTGANILNFGVGARAIGMGEAYTALADDSSSLYWNPAGVALMNQSEASFMYNQAYENMQYNHAALGLSLEHGGIGASLSYLSFGSIRGFDAQGNSAGDVNANSGVATLGGAWLGPSGSLGANVKGIQTALADVKATGIACDVGGNFIYPHEILGGSTLRLAYTVRNLGSGMTFLQQQDPFPTQWRAGAALIQVFNKKLNVSMDYGKTKDEEGAVYVGAEYWICPYLALRTGYAGSHTEGNGVRAGIGLQLKSISFDYAYANYGDLGMTHRYEIVYHFGEIRQRLTAEERKILERAKIAMRENRYGEAVLLLDSLIKMEPKYRPFRRLIRTAMAAEEKEEHLANRPYPAVMKTQKPKETLSDLDDLLELLEASESATTQPTLHSAKVSSEHVTKEQP